MAFIMKTDEAGHCICPLRSDEVRVDTFVLKTAFLHGGFSYSAFNCKVVLWNIAQALMTEHSFTNIIKCH